MTEHTIRLRGGWAYRAAGSPASHDRRVLLPVRWVPEDPAQIILTRRFGRPPIDSSRQIVILKMDRVPGIVSISLNNQPVVGRSGTNCSHELALAGLLERNVLVLEVAKPEPGGDPADWGEIALVVKTTERLPEL